MTARVLLAAVLLLAVSLTPAVPASTEEGAPLAPHPSILVEGDAGFAAPLSGVVGGRGTPEDPYRIAGWAILHTRGFGIRLVDTAAHVVIEDVLIEGTGGVATYLADCLTLPDDPCTGRGIDLEGASNVTIRRVSILAATAAIRGRDVADLTVRDSTLGFDGIHPGGLANGIDLEVFRRVLVEDVTFREALWPARLFEGSDVTLRRSATVPTATWPANVLVGGVDGARFEGNDFTRTEFRLQREVRNLTVVDNAFHGYGGLATSSVVPTRLAGVHVCGNLFEGSEGAPAVDLHNARDVLVRENRFLENYQGTRIQHSLNLTFEGNLVRDSTREGAILTVYLAEIHGNAFEGNPGGIWITRDSNATLNWWGDASGPSGAGPGTGDALHPARATVAYDPWLTARPEPPDGCGARL